MVERMLFDCIYAALHEAEKQARLRWRCPKVTGYDVLPGTLYLTACEKEGGEYPKVVTGARLGRS